MAFSLAGDLSSLSVIAFNIEIAFATDSKKIRLPIAEVLLCAAASDLARSKKHCEWTYRNSVLLPPFLKEVAILHGELDAGELLNICADPSRSGHQTRFPQAKLVRPATTIAS